MADTEFLASLKDPSLFKEANLIDGQWISAASVEQCIQVVNPANGQLLGRVPSLGAEYAEQAIKAAQQAQMSWRAETAQQRSAILRRLYELMLENQEDLARIMTAEQGKPLSESRAEIAYAAGYLEWFAEEAKRIYGDSIPSPWADKTIRVEKQPIGVFAAITPWNFPSAMIARKAAPGWAAGCAGVFKPASQTPFSALAIGALAEKAGLPAGVCNLMTGPSRIIGETLTSDPRVRKLSFTGSTEVGAQLLAQCAPTIKRTSMELGGNAPFIVFEDADLDAAVAGALASKFRNAGQTCVCTNRFLVQSRIYDAFAEKFQQAIEQLTVGTGLSDSPNNPINLGPLIDTQAMAKVQEHIQDALNRGARLLCGGASHPLGGTFFAPSLLRDVSPDSQIFSEETFGPVAPLFRFDSEAEAISLANATEFGLAAYFYSRDRSRIQRVANALEYGIVGINEGIVSTPVAPFGGVKASGMGREGSKYGIEDYLEIKYLCEGGL